MQLCGLLDRKSLFNRIWRINVKSYPFTHAFMGGAFQGGSGERLHGMQAVTGSIPVISTRTKALHRNVWCFFINAERVRVSLSWESAVHGPQEGHRDQNRPGNLHQISIIRTFIQLEAGSDLLFISGKLKIGNAKSGRTSEHGNPPVLHYVEFFSAVSFCLFHPTNAHLPSSLS